MEFNDARLYTPEESENSGTTTSESGSMSESFEGSYHINEVEHPGCAEVKISDGSQGQGHGIEYQGHGREYQGHLTEYQCQGRATEYQGHVTDCQGHKFTTWKHFPRQCKEWDNNMSDEVVSDTEMYKQTQGADVHCFSDSSIYNRSMTDKIKRKAQSFYLLDYISRLTLKCVVKTCVCVCV